jgi:hypothetical protein
MHARTKAPLHLLAHECARRALAMFFAFQWDAAFEDVHLYKSGNKIGQEIYVSQTQDMAVAWFSNTFNNSPWVSIYARSVVKHQ